MRAEEDLARCIRERDNEEGMTRGPDESEEPQVKGGKAAERLRQFLAARFGDEAPQIPPDEDDEKTEPEAPSDSSGDNGSRQG
jgi:hypothetical protein